MDEGARSAFERHGLMRLLGAELVAVGEGRCVIELPRSEDVTQHHGYFHDGAIGAMLDTAGGFAASSTRGWTDDVLTVEYKLTSFGPRPASASGRRRASCARAGRSSSARPTPAGSCAALQQTVMLGR